MDPWFTLQPHIQSIVEQQGLDVIGMAKDAHQRYTVNGKQVSLKKLYRYAQPLQSKKGIFASIQ